MALVPCAECGATISSHAKACPTCGAPPGLEVAVVQPQNGALTPPLPRSAATRPDATLRVQVEASEVPTVLGWCASCGSSDVRRVPVVYAEGTTLSASTSRTEGIGFAGGALGAGSATTTTRGTAHTVLAARLAPPAPPPGDASGVILVPLGLLVVGVIAGLNFGLLAAGGAVLGTLIVAGFLSLFGVFGGGKAQAARAALHGHAMAAWQRSVVCMRCGTVTDPGAS